jgi:hypothetical protein
MRPSININSRASPSLMAPSEKGGGSPVFPQHALMRIDYKKSLSVKIVQKNKLMFNLKT